MIRGNMKYVMNRVQTWAATPQPSQVTAYLPVTHYTVFDTTGSGDTFLSFEAKAFVSFLPFLCMLGLLNQG